MTDLNTIIKALSHDEQKSFIVFLGKKNKRNDTKNIQLFKLLAQGGLTSEQICQELYHSNRKDAFYALRKRLHQSIIDFTANNTLEGESSIEMQIIKYILAARRFLSKSHYKMAFGILDKAENLASEYQLFTLLNEIYHTKIQYAHGHTSSSLDQLIEKFNHNKKKHNVDEQLNIAYAKIREAINNVTYKGVVLDFQTLTEKIFKDHDINIEDSISFKSLYQLITIVSISAFATKEYLKIEPFLLSSYQKIKNHKAREKELYYHIHVLYMVANALFRNKKFAKSLQYLEVMCQRMNDENKKYYTTFQLKYTLLLSLNYNYHNQQEKAIKVLEPYVTKKHPDLESLLDIYLSLVTFYFQKEEINKAWSLFAKFYHTDKWYTEKAGKEWVIKKNLIEILLHLELNNIDILESRLLSFKRNYYPYLREINQKRVINYLSLVESYYKNPEKVTSESFKNKVKGSFEWINVEQEDIFVMSFYAWLKSKMIKKPLYETTLEHITNLY